MKLLPCGDTGLIVEVDGLPEVLALMDALHAAPPVGVLDVVPAARTVLLITSPGTDLYALRRAVLALPVVPDPARPAGDIIEIAVVYDGPDLAEVGWITGLGATGWSPHTPARRGVWHSAVSRPASRTWRSATRD